jgi:PII-like signaling protein
LARSEDVAVAAVLRGIEGFGPGHHLSTERLPDLSDNLPLILEIIASETRIAHLLPMLDWIVQRGIIITTPVKIIYKDKASS